MMGAADRLGAPRCRAWRRWARALETAAPRDARAQPKRPDRKNGAAHARDGDRPGPAVDEIGDVGAEQEVSKRAV